MSDDVPEPSNNPFIRFKRHVDSRIGTGLSILTGSSSSTDSASARADKPLENMDKAPKPPASGWRNDSLVPNSATGFWLLWTLQSPYSPYNLRHLPKPVPAGVSPKDAGLFDFGDAFEDLLRVSSGQNLMDLRERADRKRSLLDLFQLGESPTHWVNSLLSKKLLPEPLPKQHRFGMMFPMAVDEAWGSGQNSDILKSIEARKQQLKTLENESTAVGQPLPDSQEQKRHSESLGESWIDKLDRNITFNVASMIRQIEEMGKVIEEWTENADSQWQSVTERMTKRPEQDTDVKPLKKPTLAEEDTQNCILDDFDLDAFLNDEGEWAPERKRNTQNKNTTEPDTEEDFFSAIADAFAEMDEGLPSKTHAKCSPENEEVWRWENPAQTVQRDQVGGSSCTWSAEHFDNNGRLHQKTVVRVFDANGDQVGCETMYRVKHEGRVVKELRERTGDGENEFRASSSPNGTTPDKDGWTGWFWR